MQLDNVTVVLVGTTHPGNIGAAARAMKTMGLTRLALVAPRHFPHAEATARASGADDVLAGAAVYDSLAAALAGHVLAFGTTARARRLEWPVLDPRETAVEIARESERGRVALVFGREQSGLSNDELALTQRAVRIPTAEQYASLNLAQAVQVLAYEVGYVVHAARQAAEGEGAGRTPKAAADRPATADEVAGLAGHLERAMVRVGYLDPARPKLMRRRLGRLGARARFLNSEVQFLRGFLTRVDERIPASGSGEDEPD